MKILPKGSKLHISFDMKEPTFVISKSTWDWEVTMWMKHPMNSNMNYIIAEFPEKRMSILFDSHDVITT